MQDISGNFPSFALYFLLDQVIDFPKAAAIINNWIIFRSVKWEAPQDYEMKLLIYLLFRLVCVHVNLLSVACGESFGYLESSFMGVKYP